MPPRFPRCLIVMLLAGCVSRPVVSVRPADAPPAVATPASVDAALLMGELALVHGDGVAAREAFLHVAEGSTGPATLARALEVIAATGALAPARAALGRWQALAPEAPDVWRWRLVLEIEARDSAAAGAAAARLYALGGARAVVGVLLEERPAVRALAVGAPLADAHPDDADLQLGIALLAERSARLADARRLAQRALAARPGWADAQVLAARTALRQGAGRSALFDLERAQRAQPRDAGLAVPTASLLAEAGDAAAARAVLDAFVAAVPGDLDVRYARALLLAQGSDRALAAREFRALAELGVRPDEVPYWLGLLAEQDGRAGEALDWYRRVGDAGPLGTAVLRAARLVARREGLAAGRRVLDEVRAARPDLAEELTLGEVQLLADLDQPATARALLDGLLAARPGSEALLRRRSELAARLGDAAAAAADLRTLLARRPDDPELQNALGYTLADAGLALDEARRLLDAALAAAPDEPAIIDSAGWVRFRQGDAAGARALLERAWALQKDAEIGAHLGEVLWTLGARAEAEAVWRAAAALDPDHRVLAATRARLVR